MGLDVYLYTKQQAEANDAYDKAWEDYEARDFADDAERKAFEDAMPKYETYTSVPSERYPDHLFGRRYLRSSYNGGGFENAVPEMTGEPHGLSWIFEPVRLDGQYDVEFTEASIPALEEAKARALQVAQEIRDCDPLRTATASGMIGALDHLWNALPTEDQVLAWYRDEQKRMAGRDEEYAYSNAKGDVFGFTKGLEVLAATLGQDIIGRPVAVLVFRLNDEVKHHYVQSAEITAEFCDEAISLIRADGSCSMSWSG